RRFFVLGRFVFRLGFFLSGLGGVRVGAFRVFSSSSGGFTRFIQTQNVGDVNAGILGHNPARLTLGGFRVALHFIHALDNHAIFLREHAQDFALLAFVFSTNHL